jgi:hypothetical protein
MVVVVLKEGKKRREKKLGYATGTEERKATLFRN